MTQKNMTLPKITAKIDRLVDFEGSKIKAVASACIADAFAVHGIKVIDSVKGPFVQMPQSSYEKNGKKHYSDQFHAITAEARTELSRAVMDAYELKQGASMTQNEEELPFDMKM